MRNTRARGAVLGLLLLLVLTHHARAQGYICAEGGGNFGEGTWAGPIVGWMVAKGQKGAVVILGSLPAQGRGAEPEPAAPGAEPEPAAKPDVPGDGPSSIAARFLDAGAPKVEEFRIDAARAKDPAIARAIDAASVVFIRGGSQSRYVQEWKGTPVEASIRALFARGGVVGGTSAGCAVLGELIYDASQGSLAPGDILRDSRHPRLTLAADFLGLTRGVLFDSHFTERGRLPRLAVMLATARADMKREVIGIGCDTRTALCISPDGRAEVFGNGSVTILALAPGSRVALPAGHPPAVTDVAYLQMVAGTVYDLKARRVVARPSQVKVFDEENRRESRAAPLLAGGRLQGANIDHADWGSLGVDDNDEPDALVNGALRAKDGQARWGNVIVQTRTFDDRERVHSRVGGVQWLLSRNPGWLGVWLTQGIDAEVDDRNRIAALLPEPEDHEPGEAPAKPVPASALMVLDTTGVTALGQSIAIQGPESEGPRQSVAIEGARFHILPPSWVYRPLQPVETSPPAALHPAEANR